MNRPKLILLNGFAGAGKTTIARKYIDEHPMAMVIEGDELIVNIGHWQTYEDEARALVFSMTKAMAKTYLASGHDVILPYLVTDAMEAQAFEAIARDLNADFYEFVLHSDRTEAIARLLRRGTWGEVGQPPITDRDLPVIEDLMTKMEEEREKRPNAKELSVKGNNPETTYSQLMSYLKK